MREFRERNRGEFRRQRGSPARGARETPRERAWRRGRRRCCRRYRYRCSPRAQPVDSEKWVSELVSRKAVFKNQHEHPEIKWGAEFLPQNAACTPFIRFVLLLFSFHLVLFFYSCSFLEKGYVPRSGKRWSNQIAWSPAHSVRRGLTIGALALLLLLLELLL